MVILRQERILRYSVKGKFIDCWLILHYDVGGGSGPCICLYKDSTAKKVVEDKLMIAQLAPNIRFGTTVSVFASTATTPNGSGTFIPIIRPTDNRAHSSLLIGIQLERLVRKQRRPCMLWLCAISTEQMFSLIRTLSACLSAMHLPAPPHSQVDDIHSLHRYRPIGFDAQGDWELFWDNPPRELVAIGSELTRSGGISISMDALGAGVGVGKGGGNKFVKKQQQAASLYNSTPALTYHQEEEPVVEPLTVITTPPPLAAELNRQKEMCENKCLEELVNKEIVMHHRQDHFEKSTNGGDTAILAYDDKQQKISNPTVEQVSRRSSRTSRTSSGYTAPKQKVVVVERVRRESAILSTYSSFTESETSSIMRRRRVRQYTDAEVQTEHKTRAVAIMSSPPLPPPLPLISVGDRRFSGSSGSSSSDSSVTPQQNQLSIDVNGSTNSLSPPPPVAPLRKISQMSVSHSPTLALIDQQAVAVAAAAAVLAHKKMEAAGSSSSDSTTDENIKRHRSRTRTNIKTTKDQKSSHL